MNKFIDRTNEENINYQGCKMKIIKYNNAKDILIEFYYPYHCIIKNTSYDNFHKGFIKNPEYPSYYKVGIIGIGNYKQMIDGKQTEEYSHWRNLIKRCNSKSCHLKRPNYKDCFVGKSFIRFQDFAKWYDENKWSNISIFLDKDILVKGNKEYGKDTCVLVDNRINNLFVKSNKIRGKFPIGVHYDKNINRYIAQCYNEITTHHIGCYLTPKEAFQAYKQFKETYIKQIADEYKQKYPNFPKKLYDAMYNWKVEITD